MRKLLLASTIAALVPFAAHASYLNLVTVFHVQGTDAPDNFINSVIVTTNPSGQLIDNGKVLMVMAESTISPGVEWVTWDFETILGNAIAGDVNADWLLNVAGVSVNSLPTISHFFLDWGHSGQLFNPASDVGVNLPIETNPLTGVGTVYGQDFNLPNQMTIGGDGVANTFAAFMTNDEGVNVASANEFFMAELLAPTATSEPASLALLSVGLLGTLAFARRRTR